MHLFTLYLLNSSMQNMEYLTLATQLTLISYKKGVVKDELDKAIAERDQIFDQFVSQNGKREYFTLVIAKTKGDLMHYQQEKELLEISLAHLLARRALQSQETIGELFPDDMEHFEQVAIQDKETELVAIEKEIISLNERLQQATNSLNEFIADKEILDKHRDICRKYQEAQKTYNDTVREEHEIAKKILLIYREANLKS